MQTAIFQLPADQLDLRLLESLKLLFKGQFIEIEVRARGEKQGRKRLEERVSNVEAAKVTYEVPDESWDDLLEKAGSDEAFDVAAAIRSFKVEHA